MSKDNANIEFKSKKLRQLRQVYEKEIAEAKRRYLALIKEADVKIDAVQKTDLAAPYLTTFARSLETLERLFREMQQTHDETRGLEFNIGRYLKTCAPRNIPTGLVLERFEALKNECTAAVRAVSKSRSVEEDVEHLKVFCQCLTDLRGIQKNGLRLIKESGIVDRERRAMLSPLEADRARLEQELREATLLEKLPCYSAAIALRNEILEEYSAVCDNILGSGMMRFDGSYRFLVGFYLDDIAKEELDFAVEILQLPREAVGREPIWFHYTALHSSLLVKAPTAFMGSGAYNDFLRNLYFTFASHLPAQNLTFSGIECNTTETVLMGISSNITKLGSSYLLHPVIDELNCSRSSLDPLRSHIKENSGKQKAESINDIFEYNKAFPDTLQRFALLCVNNYPEGFSNHALDLKVLRQLIAAGSKGILSVICEATDGDFTEQAPMLTAEELHADCIEFTEDGRMRYNGLPATADITAQGFEPGVYWPTLGMYFKSAESISLEQLLQDAAQVKVKPKNFAIPIGKCDGTVFHLELTECSEKLFSLIIGGTNAGKTSFLHTMLLSAASTYSPEDLQFCLVDFKSAGGSTQFSHYRKLKNGKNLYIPHVRYLLLQGKAENAYDLVDKIEALGQERARLLESANYGQLNEYNASSAVRSGSVPKLPHIFFIIDEYNIMLSGGQGSGSADAAKALSKKLATLVATYRAYGIGVIFCGQTVHNAIKSTPQIDSNLGCRIALKVNKIDDLMDQFSLDSSTAKKQMANLPGPGNALVAYDNAAPRHVHIAYAGETNGAQQQRLAEAIRQKYRDLDLSQVEAGSERAVSILDAEDHEKGYREVPGDITLEMGISSAHAMRIPLVYAYSDKSRGYFACAPAEKLCRIERNAMFAFLHQTAGQKYTGKFRPVTYLAQREQHQACLGQYFAKVSGLRDRIGLVETKVDIARTLIELYNLFKQRQRLNARGQAFDRTPLLVVLRDLQWLSEEKPQWLPTPKSIQSQAAPDAKPADTDALLNQLKQLDSASSDADFFAALGGGADLSLDLPTADSSMDAGTDIYSLDSFTDTNVRAALSALFHSASQYGIFLLASTEIYAPVEALLEKSHSGRDTASSCGIYGSYEESAHHAADPSAPADCIFLSKTGSKIRLFDYDPDTCRDWWSNLQTRWKG